MTHMMPEARNRSLFTLREGASLVALAIFIPLAIQGALVVALWTASQWGAEATIGSGTTLSVPVAIFLLLAIRYVVLACYWIWFSASSHQSWKRALLAALPLIGLIWALKLASPVARGVRTVHPIEWHTKVFIAAVAAVSIMVMPMSMRTATTLENRENERLASPCLIEYPPASTDDLAASVGEDQISNQIVAGYVEDIATLRKGAVAKDDSSLPADVLDRLVGMRLTESLATSAKVTASVGDVEELVEEWNQDLGIEGKLAPGLAEFAIPEAETYRYACAVLLAGELTETFSMESLDEKPSEFEKKSQDNAKKLGVDINSAYGYWNPDLQRIQSEPWVESPSAVSAVAEKEAARTFDTRVEYEIATIPNQEFTGSLNWTANICIGSNDLLQPRYQDLVALYERVGGRWVRIVGAKAKAELGGRCDDGQVNLLIGTDAPEPPVNWTDKGWRTCTDYQVRIPETSNFRLSAVDMCVSTQATSISEES